MWDVSQVAFICAVKDVQVWISCGDGLFLERYSLGTEFIEIHQRKRRGCDRVRNWGEIQLEYWRRHGNTAGRSSCWSELITDGGGEWCAM